MAYQFPPSVPGAEFLAPNGVLYVYTAVDGQWEVKAFVDEILPDPTDDTQQPGTTDDRYVNISGDTMEGELNVVHPPTEDDHAASKLYVDEKTRGLCWKPLVNVDGDNNYKYKTATAPLPEKDEVRGTGTGSNSALTLYALVFHEDCDFSEVKTGHYIRIKIGGKVDEFKIVLYSVRPTGVHDLSLSVVNQETTGNVYSAGASLEISHQVECSLFVERTGDIMTGELELEDGFGNIQVFDDTTREQTAVHKKYVDDLLNDKVDKAGDTMSGTLEFNITGADATAISIKSTEADQNRIISVEGGSGSNDNLSLLLEGTDGSNNFVIRTTAGDCYSISSNGGQVFSSQVTFTDDVIFDFNSKPPGSAPFQIKGKQGNGGAGANLFKLVREASGDQLRYYGPVSQDKEVVTKEYVDSLLAGIDLSKLVTIPTGAIIFWASSVEVPDGWFKLDGSNFDHTVYTDLHTYLLSTHAYQNGKLPDYGSRFACQIGTVNNGSPGQLISDQSKKPTGLAVEGKTITFAHSHTATLTGTGSHSHTATVSGGAHSHTYSAWNTPGTKSGGGTGSKNPNTYNTARTTNSAEGSHTHTVTMGGTGNHTHTFSISTATAGFSTHTHGIVGGDETTRPLSVLGYWIIKK